MQVKNQVRWLCEIFGGGGGFVFNTVHNIQANAPIPIRGIDNKGKEEAQASFREWKAFFART